MLNKKRRQFDFCPLTVALFALLSYGRIYFFHDVMWDDNCWLLASYSSSNLEEFLSTGFYELRRVPMGVFLYYLFSLHKSSDYPYIIWHSLNIACQVFSPVVLYFFIRNYFNGKRLLSFLIASSFAVFPLDYTLPYLTAVTYRLATLLTLVSFYLTGKALEKDKHNPLLVLSLLSSAISYYIFMEMTFVFEAARFFIIRSILIKKGLKGNELFRNAFRYWLPFMLSCLPLIIYKLTFKPYGLYEDVYQPTPLFFLKIHEHVKILRIFLFQQWRVLLGFIKDVSIFSFLAGVLALIITMVFLKIILAAKTKEVPEDIPKTQILLVFKEAFTLGFIFLVFPVFLLEFTGRRIETGFSSSHFNQAQIGYAIVIGLVIYFIYVWLVQSARITNNPAKVVFMARKEVLQFIIALTFGLGVFFNNLNLDLYFHGWKKQVQFWEKFTGRFPSIPEGATFMMDLREPYFDATDLDNGYDLEAVINLLYATTENPDDFRRYKVMTMVEFRPDMATKFKCNGDRKKKLNRKEKLNRITHFGLEELDPCTFIVVLYRNGEILVNREIIEKYPDVPYKLWIEKEFPKLPKPGHYIMRDKLQGFKPASSSRLLNLFHTDSNLTLKTG